MYCTMYMALHCIAASPADLACILGPPASIINLSPSARAASKHTALQCIVAAILDSTALSYNAVALLRATLVHCAHCRALVELEDCSDVYSRALAYTTAYRLCRITSAIAKICQEKKILQFIKSKLHNNCATLWCTVQ